MSVSVKTGALRGFLLIMTTLTAMAFAACETSTTTSTTATAPTTESTTTSESVTTTTTTTTTSTTTTTTKADLFVGLDVVTELPTVGEMTEIAVREPLGGETVRSVHNPYDYSDIRVSATFTKPSGAGMNCLAFWYKPYAEIRIVGGVPDAEGYYSSGTENVRWSEEETSHFRFRITPDEAGEWTYTVSVSVGGQIIQNLSGSLTIATAEESPKGFVRVDEVNHRNFRFDDGSSYFPMGLNMAWWSTSLASHDYDNWFRSLQQNGGNFARIWMANWTFSLHKNSLNDFETRQSMAIRLDHVLQTADRHGVYILLTLLNHGQFSAVTNPEWSANVYNSANGGMLDHPIQFFTNSQAKAIYQNELLYILSRWGYSDHIMAWELFNEVDWVDGYNVGVVSSWHKTMAEFLKANDPYNHLITTSYKYTFGTDAYNLEAIDFLAVHSYAYGNVNFYQKLLGEQQTLFARYGKPVLFGEIGVDWQSGSASHALDFEGVTIRQGLWGGLMGGGAGSANQ
ncbi:MAG TPA: DUF5060 domain-containing protein, partial [Candidatus Izemoplasmatales bacterium]|nr:DUF5060 domain-containing protein [Candidatus Izemoplasmatales bacterium]